MLLVFASFVDAAQEGQRDSDFLAGFRAAGIQTIRPGVSGKGIVITALLKSQVSLHNQGVVSLRHVGRLLRRGRQGLCWRGGGVLEVDSLPVGAAGGFETAGGSTCFAGLAADECAAAAVDPKDGDSFCMVGCGGDSLAGSTEAG